MTVNLFDQQSSPAVIAELINIPEFRNKTPRELRKIDPFEKGYKKAKIKSNHITGKEIKPGDKVRAYFYDTKNIIYDLGIGKLVNYFPEWYEEMIEDFGFTIRYPESSCCTTIYGPDNSLAKIKKKLSPNTFNVILHRAIKEFCFYFASNYINDIKVKKFSAKIELENGEIIWGFQCQYADLETAEIFLNKQKKIGTKIKSITAKMFKNKIKTIKKLVNSPTKPINIQDIRKYFEQYLVQKVDA